MNLFNITVGDETPVVPTGLVHFSNAEPGAYVNNDDAYDFANVLDDALNGRPVGMIGAGTLQTLLTLLRGPSQALIAIGEEQARARAAAVATETAASS